MNSFAQIPLYLEHIFEMAEAWSKMGEPEDALNKFQMICLWLAAGRSSETAWLSWDAMDFDVHYKCVIAELPQSKVSELKLVAFMAGSTADSCFFVAVGDDMVMNGGRPSALYSSSSTPWVFPELQAHNTPGTAIGKAMRALLPNGRGGSAKKGAVAVASPISWPGPCRPSLWPPSRVTCSTTAARCTSTST
jgi:hypothetical protein